MMRKITVRTSLYTATALTGALFAQPAFADCVSQAPVNPNQVVCDNPGGAGWNGGANNGIVVTVNGGASINTNVGGPAIISTGTGSAVINFGGAFNGGVGTTYGIDAGLNTNAALNVGGGTNITNDSGAAIRGSVTFGNATGTAVNVFNNNFSTTGGPADLEGNITAGGNLTINNRGFMGYFTRTDITQTGAGTVLINNGIAGGYATPVNGIGNAFIWGNINTQGSTTLNNFGGGVAAAGNGTGLPTGDVGAVIRFNVTLGTLGNGTSTINNGGTIDGTVTMSDLNNVINNDGYLKSTVTFTGAGTNTFNAGTAGTAGDNGLRLAGSNPVTGVVSGTLQGSTAAGAVNILNLNGTGTSTLQAGSVINGFQTVNKNDAGSWLLKNTLDGTAGKLATVNVTGGTLSTDNAAFVGSAATSVKLSNATTLNFNGTAAGTFAGNIVDAASATTGKVTVTGPSTTTLSGTNTYSGTTTIDGGTLATGSNGALSANSAFTIQNGGTLIVNNQVALKSLADAGTGPNTVNLNGAATSLTLNSGSFGANGGTITGTGNLIKTTSGTFNLLGANTVNLTGGTFVINDGTVNANVAGAIGATTAVQVNSTATTTGVLNVNFSDTIGSLSGTGSNAQVNLATGAVLGTGGLNTSTTFAGKIAGGGSLVKSGTGAMTLTGSNTYSGGTSVNGGSIIGYAGSTATNGSLQGNINVAVGASVGFDQTLSPNGNTSGTYAGQLSGGGFVTFLGNGTGVLTLTGNNTGLSGNMNFFNNSIVAISSANNVGTGLLNFANGTLENTATLTLANGVVLNAPKGTFLTDPGTTLTLTGGTSGAGQLVKLGTGTLVLSGNSNHTGGTLVSDGTLQGVAGIGIKGNIVNNATVRISGILQTYTGDMSGSGNVVIFNNGGTVMAFTGNNTYTGTTTIDPGAQLNWLGANALSSGSTFVVNGILASTLTPGTNTIGGLSGSGLVVAQGTLNVGANNTSTTFSGKFGTGGFFAASTTNVNKVGTGTLTLSGTGSVLTGNLGVNAGTLSLTGTLASATTTVASGAILSVDGTLTSPTVTVASGGRLIGGIGTTPGNIVGAVTNNGTVAPGHSPGILAISGSYTQTSTGTYAADVFGNGTSTVVAGTDFDRIAVTGAPGTATLAGTLAITQNTGSLYVAGTTYDIITTTGGITGNFATVTGNTISSFLSLSNAAASGGGVIGTNYRLVVVRSAYNAAAGNPNQVAVANGLTGIIGSSGAASTINKIDNMSSAQAQALFQGLNPEPYAAYATSLQDQGELFTRQVGLRQAEGSNGKTGVWLNGYGQWANGKSADYRFGSDHRIVGGAVGVDFGTGPLRFGVAGGYSEDEVTYLGGNSAGKDKSWQVGGYMGYSSGAMHLNAQLAYITGNITASKLVNAGSGATQIQGTASADTDGHLFKGVATIGYNVGGDKLTFEPFVGIDFTSGHVNGFTETGMGTLNLTVADIEAKRTDLVVGARFAAPTGSIMPYANVTYRYNLNDNPSVVTGYFNGVSGAPFTVLAIGSGRSVVDVDAGISAKIGSGASVFVGYQGTFRNDLNSHGVNGGLRVSF